MVLWGFWVGRRHLWEVVRKALDSRYPYDDREEMMSCRTALVVLLVSSGFCIAWLWQAGREIAMILTCGAASFFLYIGIARIVAESGLLYVRGPLSAQVVSLYRLGSRALEPATVTATGFTYTTISQGRGLFMAALAQIARLRDFVGDNRRRTIGAIALAFAVALATSIVGTLYMGYTHGTQSVRTWHIRAGGAGGVQRYGQEDPLPLSHGLGAAYLHESKGTRRAFPDLSAR